MSGTTNGICDDLKANEPRYCTSLWDESLRLLDSAQPTDSQSFPVYLPAALYVKVVRTALRMPLRTNE